MKNELKVGQRFEVVEWVSSPVTSGRYVGKQCFKYKGYVYTPSQSNGNLIDFDFLTELHIKPIGKLTITKLK